MCGICGRLAVGNGERTDRSVLDEMVRRLTHRGPDGNGVYVSGPIALGHTRLSIIDLESGAQPLANEDESIWVVFNGEIYNYAELREQLIGRGHRFRTHSDTEVLVHLYEDLGDSFVTRLDGMFALAIWDANSRRLFCARDRVGIKPLYYAVTDDAFIFASEIKSLLADPAVQRTIDQQAIDNFFQFTYIPGERTLLKAVRKLAPGHFLSVKNGEVVQRQYWDLEFGGKPEYSDFDEACHALRSLVKRTVRQHMVSDVPVGVLLSGGVDSTIVLSCATEASGHPVQTFTVGFDEREFEDERVYARMVAEKFGADHHSMTISGSAFGSFLEPYVWHMEEPVYEPPAIALHCVSELASRFVKVVLSGEGADEAFAGYHNYPKLIWLERIKGLLGKSGAASLGGGVTAAANALGMRKLNRYGSLLGVPPAAYYYSRRATPFGFFGRNRERFFTEAFLAAVDHNEVAEMVRSLFARVNGADHLSQMLYVDSKTWLPDDLLVKADKMTMANSLELRVPFLDHHVLTFAARLPSSFKIRGLTRKRVLKRAFQDSIPSAVLNRKKAGFPVPIDRWLRVDLKGMLCDTLLSARCRERGYYAPGVMERLLKDFSGGKDLTIEVFSLLVLELWHRTFVDGDGAARPLVA